MNTVGHFGTTRPSASSVVEQQPPLAVVSAIYTIQNPTSEPVEVVRLDDLHLPGCDVMKIDVEGMEHHISPSTLRAIAALTQQLRRRPALRAQLQTAAV